MIRKNPSGHLPQVHPDAFIDPTAIVCGRVIVEEDVYIGPYTVIRADETDADGRVEPFIIGAGSNLQDGVVIHSKSGAAVTIGRNSSIAHCAIIHGPCTIGNNVFIGFSSVIFHCVIGDGCMVRHNAVVDGCDLPPGFYVPSTTQLGPDSDLSVLPRVMPDASEFSEDVARTNRSLVRGYKRIANEL